MPKVGERFAGEGQSRVAKVREAYKGLKTTSEKTGRMLLNKDTLEFYKAMLEAEMLDDLSLQGFTLQEAQAIIKYQGMMIDRFYEAEDFSVDSLVQVRGE